MSRDTRSKRETIRDLERSLANERTISASISARAVKVTRQRTALLAAVRKLNPAAASDGEASMFISDEDFIFCRGSVYAVLTESHIHDSKGVQVPGLTLEVKTQPLSFGYGTAVMR